MNVWRAVLAFWLLTLVTVGALRWIDRDKGLLPVVLAFVVVLLLTTLEFSIADSAIAAIDIRIATLWFATLPGLLSKLVLEIAPVSDNAQTSA